MTLASIKKMFEETKSLIENIALKTKKTNKSL